MCVYIVMVLTCVCEGGGERDGKSALFHDLVLAAGVLLPPPGRLARPTGTHFGTGSSTDTLAGAGLGACLSCGGVGAGEGEGGRLTTVTRDRGRPSTRADPATAATERPACV